ncbi:MAG: segregation/condensation protein A, partial [Chthoniobacteraceae bacterium]|nr:segregation/condensation protein A [Chthoniobacteraceae bacterium]
ELAQEALFSRISELPDHQPERPLGEVSVLDLIAAFNGVLKRINQREDLREIFEENFTVSDKIELVLKMLSGGVPMDFTELFSGIASRAEIVVTFLAVLELIRLKQLKAVQLEPFGKIELTRA